MNANFKTDSKIIITGADNSEALLIEKLVALSSTQGKKVTISTFPDVEGNVYGLVIEVVNTVQE